MAFQDVPNNRAVNIIQNLMDFIDENDSKSKFKSNIGVGIPSAASVSYVTFKSYRCN